MVSLCHAFEVFSKVISLLNGCLRQLWMSVGIIFIAFNNTLVAYTKHVVESFNPIKYIHFNAPSTPKMDFIKVSHLLCCHTTHPNKRASRDRRAIGQHHLVVFIIGYHLVQQNVYTHFS